MLKPTVITTFDLPELWFRALFELWHQYSGDSREYMVMQGSFAGIHKRKEFDYFVGHVTNPGNRPLAPAYPALPLDVNPTTDDAHIGQYFARYIIGTEIAANEAYTYGSRIVPQLDRIIELLKKTPDTNQAIIQVGRPEDCILSDPPCLRTIDLRIKDGKLHCFPYFRSWDLYAGLPENLGGIQLLKEYLADEIGVEDGEMIVSSKGLHVYDYAWEQVSQLVRKASI